MPECPSIDSLVTPYVDDALLAADREFVERHADSCAFCRSRIAAERSVRELLRERRSVLQGDAAPPALRVRCATVARFPIRQTEGVRKIAPLMLAASLTIVVGGAALYWATRASARVMAAELTVDHMKCSMVNAMFGLAQAQAEVEQSLASSFGWNARLPERPQEVGLELSGVRPCWYGEGRVAHVMYHHDGRLVSLFMLPGGQRADELISVLGHEAAIWSTGERTFVLVAREPPAEVQRIASFVTASMR